MHSPAYVYDDVHIAEMQLGRLQLHRRPVKFNATAKRAPKLESRGKAFCKLLLHTL